MKRKTLHKKLIKTYNEHTVYNWLNGNRTPKYHTMIELKDNFKIPLHAWEDIKAFLDDDSKSK